MEFAITQDPIIRCECCGAQQRIPCEDLDYENFYVGEYGMGPRWEHYFQYDGICGECGSSFTFVLKGDEYPEGSLEYQSHQTSGCDFVFAPDITINYVNYYVPDEYESRIAYDVNWLIEQIKRNYSVAYQITSRQFEEIVAELFVRKGYKVTLTPPQKDGGKDIIAKRNDDGIPICLYVECKQYDADNPVGVSIVRSAAGVRAHDKVNKAIIVTTSRFTRDAFRFANEEEHLIQLMSLEELLR